MKLSQLCINLVVLCLYIPLWECSLVREEDICEIPRTRLFAEFLSRAESAFENHEQANLVLNAQPLYLDSAENTSCKVDKSQFLGFWSNNGHDLCLVVQPERQTLWKAKCCGESCCGSSSRCVPQFRNFAPLFFCSRLIWVPGDGDDTSVPPEVTILGGPSPASRRKRNLDHGEDTNGYRQKRSTSLNEFVVFVDFKLPVSCECQRKSCS